MNKNSQIRTPLWLVGAAILALSACGNKETETSKPGNKSDILSCGDQALYSQAHQACEAMNVAGEGKCYCALGFYWDGQACVGLDGACQCVGTDCNKLTQSLEECQAQHATCGGSEPQTIKCGDQALFAELHQACDAMDVAGEGKCYCALGFYWDGQACVGLDGACECIGKDCNKLTQSLEECQAQHFTCEEPQTIKCGDQALFSQLHQACGAMDVAGEGKCYCALGFYWDGQACVGLGGVCECIGKDCNKLTQSLEECQAQHATCAK